jgi:HSP20 family protein
MDTILLKTNKGSTKGLPEDHSKNVPKSLGWQISAPSHVWSPPTDLVETDEKFVVRVEIAGLRDQDFSVTLDKNYLVIAGSRPDIAERRAYHQMEIRFGEFSTVVALPGPVNPEKTVAEYSDGFLEVTLPKLHPK